MTRCPIALLALLGLIAAVPAEATPAFPYRYHTEQNIDNHQVGFVDVVVNGDGSGTVTARFSNGKQLAGNTFAAETVFAAADGVPLLSVRQTKGLDGSWGGHAREGSVINPIHLNPEQLRLFDHVEVQRMRALNDGIEGIDWNKVWLVFSTAIDIITGGDTYHQRTAPSLPRLDHGRGIL
jgi:hypothetical protein